MTFLFIASIIICPMWMATCPCEADSVVGKLKTTAGKVSVRSEASSTDTSGLFGNVFLVFLVVRLWGPNYPSLLLYEVPGELCIHKALAWGHFRYCLWD